MNRLEQLLHFQEENPHDSFIQYCIAMEYEKCGDLEKALNQYVHLIEKDPAYLATYYMCGKMYEQLQNMQEAIIIYTQGMAIAQKQKDMHTFNELQNAKNAVEDDL